MNKKFLLFLLIILIALFFRLYQLANVPPSASLDEASIGWNAYSIMSTGKDEYGQKFPILLRAYDDFRPALYVYMVIPFIEILGLNVVAVRLPSVLLSIVTIISSYFLVKSLFKTYKYRDNLALFVSFLLAVSPWSIYISRLGHEANAGLAFSCLGILFFILSCDGEKKWRLLLSAIFFALSFYTYQSEKVFVPLIALALSLIYFKKLLKIKKVVFVSLFAGIILSLPIFFASFSANALVRFNSTNSFDISNPMYLESARNLLDAKNHGNVIGEIINNRRVTPFRIFVSGFVTHLNPVWIFGNITGGDSFKAPEMGLLYLWEAPFFGIGILLLFTKKYSKKQKSIILCWIGASLVAPAISTQTPHAMRAYNMLPMPQLLVAFGFINVLSFFDQKTKKYIAKTAFIFLMSGIISVNGIYFFRQYFEVFPLTQSASFQYALSQAIKFVLKNEDSYKKIVLSNRRNLGQSYMFYLFYSKYDPNLYQKQGGTQSGGFAKAHSFGKIEFRPVNWSEDRFAKKTLFVANMASIPNYEKPLAVFRNLGGLGVIKVVGK